MSKGPWLWVLGSAVIFGCVPRSSPPTPETMHDNTTLPSGQVIEGDSTAIPVQSTRGGVAIGKPASGRGELTVTAVRADEPGVAKRRTPGGKP